MLGCESIAAYSHIYNTEHAIQTGKEIPLDARTYPASTSRLLYTEAASYRGKFPIDDHYASITKASCCAAWHGESKVYVRSTGCQGRDTKTKTADASEHDLYGVDISGSETPAHAEGQPPSTANAAVALAQLHANNPTLGWEADFVRFPLRSILI